MSKTLKTAALIVGSVALVATGVGAAAGVGIGLGLSAGTLATIATVATIASVASGVLTLAVALTAKKPSAQATGSQTDFSADPDAGIPLVIGRTGTAGDITARFGFDTADKGDNDRQAFVVDLSLGPVAAVEGMTVDRNGVTYGPTGAAIGAFAGFMWSMTQIGAMPEPAALGFGAGAGSPPGWTAQHKKSGMAAATWTMRFDTNAKLFQNGVPAPMWTVRGARCYDPTKDGTYPGGNGAHRMADPADTAAYDAAMDSWEWTENPYLVGLHWAHGFWQRDRSNPNAKYQRVMGMGANWSGIDVAAFVEGRNIAQANGWKVGGVIYSGDNKWDSMKKILQAGMGEPLALGARISCFVNAPKVSLATITIDDVIGTASVAATQPRRSRINTITPRYRLEENNWQLLPGTPISIAEHVAEDRGKRSKVQDYPFIQQTAQVATAVRYDIENAREFGPITLPLKLAWMGYKPGDCVTAVLPELGLNAQPILLLNRELGAASGVVTMTARSETAAKHPFALGQTTTPPPTPGVSGPPLTPVPGEAAWAITDNAVVSGEVTVPALIVTGAIDAATVEVIIVEYRPFVNGQSVDAGWIGVGAFAPDLKRAEVTGVRGGTAYEVSISYQRRGITGNRRVLGPVTTAGTLLDFAAVTGPTRPEPNADVTGNHKSADTNAINGRSAQEVLNTLDVNVTGLLEQALRQDDFLQVVQGWSFVEGQPVSVGFLSFRNEQLGVNSALASQFTSVFAKAPSGTGYTMNLDLVKAGNATLADLFSGYTAGISGFDGDLTALQGTVGTLSVKVSTVVAESKTTTASVKLLQEAFATDGGGFARFVLKATVDANGRAIIAGISGVATSNNSELNFAADSFNFVSTADGTLVKPFSIVGNAVYTTNLIAGSITYDSLVQRFTDVGQQNLDPNGWYQVFPGGMIMQGGRYRGFINSETTFSVQFPRPFPNQVLAVGAMPFLSGFSNVRDLWIQNVGEPTLTGSTFATQAASNTQQRLDGFDWWAWGK